LVIVKEIFETWEECARREVREEMGIELHCGEKRGSDFDGGGDTFADCEAGAVSINHDLASSRQRQLPGVEWGHATNDVMRSEGKHYVTIFMLATHAFGGGQEPQTMEPDKCDGWCEYSWKDLVLLAEEEKDDGVKGEGDPPATDGAFNRRRAERLELFEPLRQLVRDNPERVLDYLRRARLTDA
jgi:8-oxo-dGTP pyrophosphatase MutT (NUDIX family)